MKDVRNMAKAFTQDFIDFVEGEMTEEQLTENFYILIGELRDYKKEN